MLTFHPGSPFPLIPPNVHSLQEEQVHSEAVDSWLGLRVLEVEKRLLEKGCRAKAGGEEREHQQLWIGLEARSLLTPYTEIRSLLAQLSPLDGQTVIDLGAAYGRMGFVIGHHYPGVQFIGYEYVGERVHESRRCADRFKYPNVRMDHMDISSSRFIPEEADFYFIYDYGNAKSIEKTLHDLRRISALKPITVIGRGRKCREAIEIRHHWLFKAFPNEGEGRITVYRSLPNQSRPLSIPCQ